jgi:hypothetical protein
MGQPAGPTAHSLPRPKLTWAEPGWASHACPGSPPLLARSRSQARACLDRDVLDRPSQRSPGGRCGRSWAGPCACARTPASLVLFSDRYLIDLRSIGAAELALS